MEYCSINISTNKQIYPLIYPVVSNFRISSKILKTNIYIVIVLLF
jgi:hypothetical protein